MSEVEIDNAAIAQFREAMELADRMFHPDVAAVIRDGLARGWERVECGEPAWYADVARPLKAARRLIEGVACVPRREADA